MWIVWLFNQALFTGIFPCSQAAWEHQFFPLVSAVSTFDCSPAHPAAPQPPCWGEGWLMLSSINSNAQNPGVQGQPCLLTGHPQGCLEGLRSNIWGSKHFPPGAIQSYGLSGCIWAWGYNDSISSSSLCAGALPHVCYEKLPAVWRARQYNKLHININEPLSLLWEKVNVITMLYSANKCLRQFF